MKRLYVTGTDTGVGKTAVGCALAAAYRSLGRTIATLKPIETGCEPATSEPSELVPSDALRLAEAAGESLPPTRALGALCPNRYPLPASPEAAAAHAGRPIDRGAIDRAIADRAGADLLLIEGAGGLLVPIAPGVLQADLALATGAPVVVVARNALGTVNHTLLTVEAARARGIPLAGVILHDTAAGPGSDAPSNADAIARHGRVQVLGVLPWAASESPEVLGELAKRHLDLEGLWRAL